MTPALTRLLQRIRRRDAQVALLPVVPWAVVAGGAWTWGTPPLAVGLTGSIGAVLLILRAFRWARLRTQRDAHWLLRRLEDQRPDLEDSADLISRPVEQLSPLQQLQRAKVLQRLAERPLPALNPPLPWRATAASFLLALLIAGLPGLLPPPPQAPAVATTTPARALPVQQSIDVQLTVTPPAYTGLPERAGNRLALEVAEGSRLRWSLGFAIAPTAVRLRFVDGSEQALAPEADRFVGERSVTAATLYRVELDGAPALDMPLQRIDVISDRAPQLRVLAPERTLTVLDAAQRTWPLQIEAEDDYALGAAALTLTLAQGSGEQVTVSEQRVTLRGTGDARKRSYRHVVDLDALGYGRGDDLIARFEVQDNRAPEAHTARTPALILRWPSRPAAEGTGVEGLVQRTLPAYFRSQRQIIIDTEALIAERPRLAADTLVKRSDLIGVDQRILRLRYGQFLGEEAEAGTLPGSGPAEREHEEEPGAHSDDDGHDHGTDTAAPAGFGEAGTLLAEVGHLHDIAEAATLLDPRTKRLLREALGEMWRAEGHLRLGEPEAALPFEYRALALIKQVQQANRIYLARVGLELPPVDFSRRLSGEKRPRGRAADPLIAASPGAPDLRALWQQLDAPGAPPSVELREWLERAPSALPDPLSALAEIDALERDPDCLPCRRRLQQQLWPALPMPAAGVAARSSGGQAGAVYLDATGAAR